MKYPIKSSAIIDVTKPPYCADNTGKTDCTQILCKILDDILIHQIEELRKTYDKLIEISCNKTENAYIGLEGGRVQNGKLEITYAENEPASKIIYFPKGTYLVSDTITYSLKNLKQIWYWVPNFENNRNIHFMGESMKDTVIRLADNSKGFEVGKEKPLISFVNNELQVSRKEEFTNVAFMNTIEDITLDCGIGNCGAVGIKYVASNCGRIENVNIKTEQGMCGIYIANNSTQGVFTNINISGFDYGIDAEATCLVALDNIDVSATKIAGVYTDSSSLHINNLICGKIPAVKIKETVKAMSSGRYYFTESDEAINGAIPENHLFVEDEKLLARDVGIPSNQRSENPDDWALVDDFGAKGDGITDSTRAIQKAMNSGKSVIIFGAGEYLIDGKIKIPKTVKTVDFMFCSLACGTRLVGGEYDAAFEISEDCEDLIFIENLSAWEKFKGHIHLIKHAARRDAVFSDIHLMSASMYFNSVSGSKVYFDNVFLTTGTYTPNVWLPGEGFVAVYSNIIPYEFYGQDVYGRVVNPERAAVAMLNDGSNVLLDCYRTEGPGTAIKCINGGKTRINLLNAALGLKELPNPLLEVYDSEFQVKGACVFAFDENSEYNILVHTENDEKQEEIKCEDAKTNSLDSIEYTRIKAHSLTFNYKA